MSGDKLPTPHYLGKYDALMTFWAGKLGHPDMDLDELERELDRIVLSAKDDAIDLSNVHGMFLAGLASVGFYAVVEHMRDIIKEHEKGGYE